MRLPNSLKLAAISTLIASSAHAAGYQWNGTTSSDWSTAGNWSGAGTFFTQVITAGPGPTGGTFAHRLNVLNGAGSPLIYDASLGTTVYANSTPGTRGLVMSSGTAAPSSSFIITGGSFSTLGSAAQDVLGNSTTSGTTVNLTVNGGNFTGANLGTIVNFGGTSNVATFNVTSGTATTTFLTVSNAGGGSGTVNLDGGILQTYRLNKVSTGVATFNFNGGTLRAGREDATFMTGLNAANVKSGGAFIDTNGFDITIGQNLLDGTGGGGLTKSGAGKLTLTGTSTYTGTTTISAGSLGIGNGGATGSVGSGPIVNNGSDITINRSGTLSIPGAISGTGGLTQSGTVTTNLGGANTYTGATTVNSGTLNINGSLTSTIAVANATLGGEGSTSGAVTFTGASGLNFDPSTPGALSVPSADLTGATLVLAPSAPGSGSGIVALQSATSITGFAGNVSVAGRGSASLSGDSTQILVTFTPASLVWTGDGASPTFWDTATANFLNGVNPEAFVAGDNVTFNDSATTFTVAIQGASLLAGNTTFDNSVNAYTVSGGALAGGGTLTKNGTNTLTLATANTYTGQTIVNGGTLIPGVASALGATTAGTVINAGGTVDFNGLALAAEPFELAGGKLANSGAAQINAVAGPVTVSANSKIGGVNRWDVRAVGSSLTVPTGMTLTKEDANQVTVVGRNTVIDGTVQIDGGIFGFHTAGSYTGTGNIVVNAGAEFQTGSYGSATPLAIPYSLAVNNGILNNIDSSGAGGLPVYSGNVALTGTATISAPSSFFLNGVVSGTGTLSKTGANTLFLGGANDFTGDLIINAGFVVANHASALGASTNPITVPNNSRIEVNGVTISGRSAIINGASPNFFGALQGRAGTAEWTGPVTIGSVGTRIGAAAGTFTVSGVIDSAGQPHGVLFRPQNATATVVVSGANTYLGDTGIVGAGGVVRLAGGANRLPITTNLVFGTGTTSGILDLNGQNQEVAGLSVIGGTTDTITSATPAVLTVNGAAASSTFSGSLTGALSLVKSGANSLTLTGTRTYTGNTTVAEGTLSVSSASFDDASTVSLATGAVLDLAFVGSDTVASLVVNGTPLAAGTYDAATSPTFITGTGSITIPATNGFATWQSSNFTVEDLGDPLISGEDADPDGDGLSNTLEFALGGLPKTSDGSSRLPQSSVDAGLLVMTYLRPEGGAPGVAYAVQVNTNLQAGGAGWTTATPVTDYVETTSTVGMPAGFEKVTITFTAAVGTGEKRFGRINVSF